MTEKIRLLIPGNTYRYQLTNTGHSSAKFGNCEICRTHASEVWSQSEQRQYKPGRWTYHQCTSLFGHRDCLEKQQREPRTEALEENTGAQAPVGETK